MDVSVIIVSYNTCILTHDCLKSVFEQTKEISYEVIVSDNGSKDGTIEMIKKDFPQVILIENNENIGFGAANNRGLKKAVGKYILYLNSDTILLNNALKIFFEYWEGLSNQDYIGALGSNLLDETGNYMLSYGSFPKSLNEIRISLRNIIVVYAKLFCNVFHIKYHNTQVNNTRIKYKTGDVDYIVGADLFMKNNEYAFFDERYFLYYEETHIEWQMMKCGLKRVIIDGPKIVHLHGKSDHTKKNDGRLDDYVSFSRIHVELSRIKFIKYNISNFAALIMKLLLSLYWLTPIFYNKTKQYRKEIWKI